MMRKGSQHTQSMSKYPELQRKTQEEKKKQQEMQQQLIDEWGFENEATKKMFMAKLSKRNQTKKKKDLTADEKLQRFLAAAKRK